MEDCPDGELTKDQFIEMYNKIFPGGRADRFSEIIFRTFDADRRDAVFKKLWKCENLPKETLKKDDYYVIF